jgi:hypothetical protein
VVSGLGKGLQLSQRASIQTEQVRRLAGSVQHTAHLNPCSGALGTPSLLCVSNTSGIGKIFKDFSGIGVRKSLGAVQWISITSTPLGVFTSSMKVHHLFANVTCSP